MRVEGGHSHVQGVRYSAQGLALGLDLLLSFPSLELSPLICLDSWEVELWNNEKHLCSCYAPFADHSVISVETRRQVLQRGRPGAWGADLGLGGQT